MNVCARGWTHPGRIWALEVEDEAPEILNHCDGEHDRTADEKGFLGEEANLYFFFSFFFFFN